MPKKREGPFTKQFKATVAVMEKHRKAVDAYYFKHGVGKTFAHKFRFWASQHDEGGFTISHSEWMDDRQKVLVFETSWLAEQFPGDFKHC